jgi:hypothetical protein
MNAKASHDPAVLVHNLVDRGVPERKARRIVKHFSANGIRRQLTYYDFEMRPRDRREPEWLVERIEADWRAPDGYSGPGRFTAPASNSR